MPEVQGAGLEGGPAESGAREQEEFGRVATSPRRVLLPPDTCDPHSMVQSSEAHLPHTFIMASEQRGRMDATGSAMGILQRTASSSSGELLVFERKSAIWR